MDGYDLSRWGVRSRRKIVHSPISELFLETLQIWFRNNQSIIIGHAKSDDESNGPKFYIWDITFVIIIKLFSMDN